MSTNIHLNIFSRHILIDCHEESLASMLESLYAAFIDSTDSAGLSFDLRYKIYIDESQKIVIQRQGQEPLLSEDDGLFVYQFEKDMTIALERIRQDLYFIHAAALAYQEKICLLVADSGSGKSTTSWALLHHGFDYASDELAPVDVNDMCVTPYPHALCLKREPPSPYVLPDDTLFTERTLHIPISAMPCQLVEKPLPVHAIFFIHYNSQLQHPSYEPVSVANAGARIYANGLNQLAHPGDGLDAAIRIAEHCSTYQMQTADLEETAALIKSILDQTLI